jgi:hypothetical protein
MSFSVTEIDGHGMVFMSIREAEIVIIVSKMFLINFYRKSVSIEKIRFKKVDQNEYSV